MAVRQMLVAGRYRLLEPVGTGGMGRVWLSRDEMLDRDVAVKEFVPPEWMSDDEKTRLRDRTLREARSAARIDHPHVVRIYDVVHAEGLPWIVMEYVPSRSLYQVIAEDGPFTPEGAARIGLDVLDALTAAHAAGVLHRDVKPHNVLIGPGGRVVLTDFGLATFVDDGSVTGPGLIVGSPQYVSPERARDGASTVESDLWSLGATLYAAVEGRSPYARESAMATLMALATEPPDPPVLAGPLAPVLTGLLRRPPADRLTAAQVAARLTAIASSGPSRAPAVRAVVPGPRIPGQRISGQRGARQRALTKPEPVFADPERADPERAFAEPVRAVPEPVRDEAAARSEERHPAPVTVTEPAARPHRPVPGPRKARPAAATDEADPAAAPGRARPRVALIGLLTFAVLGAGGVAAGYLMQRDNRPRTAGPVVSGSPETGADRGVVAAPGGFSPLACSAEPSRDAPRTPQPGAARSIKGYDLLPGYSAFTDPSGFRIAVPDGWTYERIGTTVCFRDPGNLRILSLDNGRDPAGDPVKACRREAQRLVRQGALPGYRELGIERGALAVKAADWEYTYAPEGSVRMHATTRWFVSGGDGYALGWITRDFDWPQNWSTYRMIQGTFEATA